MTGRGYAGGMAKATDATLITSARNSRTLDLEERQRRYLITMGLRTACFLAFLVVPGWWKLVALAGAALLPAIAVLLANGEDHHPPATVGADDSQVGIPALPPSSVVPGTLEENV